MDALNNHYTVNIMYDSGKGDENVKRYCQIYALGKTSKGHDAIRVFQFYPYTRGYMWKTFRVDRIVKWNPTKWRFYRPISNERGSTAPRFDPNNDKTLNHGDLAIAKFDDKYRL